VKWPVSVLAVVAQVALVPSVRAQPQLSFDSSGTASGILAATRGPFEQTITATQRIAGNRRAMNDLQSLALIAGSLDSRTVAPQQRPSGISYVSPTLFLSGVRGSAVIAPSAFLAAQGAFIDSANLAATNPLPTAPPDGHVKSAPKESSSRIVGSRDAITIQIRPPSFLMLLGNVAAIALLGYAWRRLRARPASSRNRV
jgi:hypothetical protein